jgi:hypothetical protein
MVAQAHALWIEDNELIRAYIALPNWVRTLAKYIASKTQ